VAASAQYRPIVDHLEAELGVPFTLVPLDQEEQFELVEAGELDFIFSNPLASVQLRRLYGTEFLATLSRVDTGTEFSGLIISRADSDLDTIEDIPGKRVACVAFETAAAGCNFQVMHLLERGITPDEFGSFSEISSQDNIVLAVLSGSEDVGFIRSGQLERMLAEGTLVSLDEIQIIDRADDDFHFPHTTRLYPEWPFAALAGTDRALVESVREALLGFAPGDPALEQVNAEGFTPATSYDAIDQLVVALQLRSWDAS
jgi:ABC-type phosphate/phosphonate transport system substrate-binding protein